VKKDKSSNKGRWFYTCRKHSKHDGNCKFFLWEDQAKHREGARPVTPEQDYNEPSPTPTPTIPSTISHNNNKRKYDEVEEGSDSEFGGFEVSPEEAAEIEFNASQASQSSPMPTPQTPRKAVKTGNLATPGEGRALLATPVTGGRSLEGSRDIQTPSAPPEESVERRAEMGKTGYAVTDDVMEVLKGKVDAQTSSKVQTICDKFGMKLSGIERGRDITRVALKSKDEKIEELKKRVAGLEAEVEKKKAVIKAMADSL
jgi:polyhydroxyalkanoate synthesis regulator phasin